MNRHKSDNVPVELQMDTIYKKKLVEFLLDRGEISANDRMFISQQLAEVYGPDFDRDAYERALKVIEDYAKTGGENTQGGDGFGEKAAYQKRPIRVFFDRLIFIFIFDSLIPVHLHYV